MNRRSLRLSQLGNGFQFDAGATASVLIFLAGCGLTALGYYVKTQASGAAARDIESASDAITKRFEHLGDQLMAKIDGLRDAISAVNLTLGRAEEQTAQHAKDIGRLDARLTYVERRVSHLPARTD